MARVDLRNLSKHYASAGITALDNINLTIEPGEFFTLLGPSGCGKTTLLRTIAGFNQQDSGEIWFDKERIDTMPAHRRNIGMVYQDYAIFPHKSVADNVAFGLEMRKVPRADIAKRVSRALTVVQLDGLGARMPHELSGGQQQRVALARAMVINPQILLMDEPLSNLDAKLRIELREDIRAVQRSLGITTIYVTHDQEEALVISDRICVMHGGRVHQVASPLEVYAKPATLFVGTFVGTMNVLGAFDAGKNGEVTLGPTTRNLEAIADQRNVTLGIRPEDVVLISDAQDPLRQADHHDALAFPATVETVTYAGREAWCRLTLPGAIRITAHLHRPDPSSLPTPGRSMTVILPLARLHAFGADGARIA